ncbi:MAG: class I SAM-dependent methyltransferase [Deltaproteobacteria bacterium]|nr:class I SAM-dependent methyltransferase [Deltaproteobacteria bacterium]
MAGHVCPFWAGYLLLSPLRRMLENPYTMLGPFVEEGMTVLEPGCGMGYFTLPLARMVGPGGRVVVVEIEPKMLSAVERRARKAGLLDRIVLCLASGEGPGVEGFLESVDFAPVLYMAHEVPDQAGFFLELWKAIKSGGRMLVLEPKFHVTPNDFERAVAAAESAGFRIEKRFDGRFTRNVLMGKP